MAAFATERVITTIAREADTPVNEVVDAGRSLAHELRDGVGVTQAGS